jgi:hypothetical protein
MIIKTKAGAALQPPGKVPCHIYIALPIPKYRPMNLPRRLECLKRLGSRIILADGRFPAELRVIFFWGCAGVTAYAFAGHVKNEIKSSNHDRPWLPRGENKALPRVADILYDGSS